MSVGLEVERDTAGRADVVAVRGELDMATAITLAGSLNEVLTDNDGPVIVDLSGLRFMDSTGMSVLLNAHRRLARQGRSLTLACPEGPVLRVFQLTNMVDTLRVRPSREDAEAEASA